MLPVSFSQFLMLLHLHLWRYLSLYYLVPPLSSVDDWNRHLQEDTFCRSVLPGLTLSVSIGLEIHQGYACIYVYAFLCFSGVSTIWGQGYDVSMTAWQMTQPIWFFSNRIQK